MTVPMASSIGSALPEGSVVHARLVTPLSSATSHQGEDVEAVLSQPLMDGDRLILPQGSWLKGTVKQAQPARRMKKNGQLRVAFSELTPPDGIEQKIVSTLQGVQAGKDANVKLDSEGGAEATTSKTRYLGTAVSLGLAMMAAKGGDERDSDGNGGCRRSRWIQIGRDGGGRCRTLPRLRRHHGSVRSCGFDLLAFHCAGTRSGIPQEYRYADWNRNAGGNRNATGPAGSTARSAV